jgi:hypothetical protein
MNGTQFNLGSIPSGGIVFATCPQLHPGRHEIELFAKDGPFVQEVPLGRLELYVRAPRAWESGRGTQGPLLVDVEPFNPTLEQLREGKVQLTIRGPKDRELVPTARIFQGGNESPIFSKQLPKLLIPLAPETWNRYVQKYFLELPEVADFYDVASSCSIEFSGGELGAFALRFARESVPVWWAVRRASGRTRQISIVSEAIEGELVEVESRTFENPDIEGHKDRLAPNSWAGIPQRGGLLVARVGKFVAAIVLAPEVHELRDLQAAVSVKAQPRTLQSILAILESTSLWASARLSGNFLSGTRQRAVIRALVRHLHSVLCGETWERIESMASANAPDGVLRLFGAKPQESEIVKAILSELPALAKLSPRERAEWLYEKTRRPLNLNRVHRLTQLKDGTQKWIAIGEDSPIDPKFLIEFSLRLASDPAHIGPWAQDMTRPALEKIFGQPAISRMARLMVVVVDQQLTASNQGIGSLYAGWGW